MATNKTTWAPGHPSPAWATWLFRIFYGISTVAGIWLGSTNLIADGTKVEILLAFGAFDRFAWILAKGLGVKKQDFELPETTESAKDGDTQ